MKPIGALKIKFEEKQVTNEAYWRPENQDYVKSGYQYILLTSEKSTFSKTESSIELIG
ncbi:hypothetical protein [Bacillus sp. ISL-55]|uniref:hypothetical protein n=1 Tax=Bacillus sp. ISL-55 TaxID=2819134 RepID=UPI001BEC325C|nr:hypothetical protein [Bacillus sp. ISL-55]MBT2695411.1 hypothetical protein [Bacillus sp. ISL-55]